MLTIQVFQLEIERMIDQDGRFRLWRYRRLRFRLDSRFRVVRLRRLCFRGKAVPQYDCNLIQAARQLLLPMICAPSATQPCSACWP